MSLYHIDNSKILVSKEKTAIIPINFNDFQDKEKLINTLNKHDGLIQNSIATMLRLMESTSSNTLELSLKKLLSVINDIHQSNLLTNDTETEKKLELSLKTEKELQDSIKLLNSEIDDLKNQKQKAENKIAELEAIIHSKEEKEKELSNTPETHPSYTTIPSSDAQPVSTNNEKPSDNQEPEPDIFSNASPDNNDINFNNLVHKAKFSREANPNNNDLNNLNPEALANISDKKNLDEMRSKLFGNETPNAYEETPQSKIIDDILEKALDNLEKNDALDLNPDYDDNAKDALLAETLKIYENLDIESYPELYEVDKNSILQELEKKLSIRRQEIRLKKEIKHSEIEEDISSKTNPESLTNPNTSDSSKVFNKEDIKQIDPSQAQNINNQNTDPTDLLSKALNNLSEPDNNPEGVNDDNNDEDHAASDVISNPVENLDKNTIPIPDVLQKTKDETLADDKKDETQSNNQNSTSGNLFSGMFNKSETANNELVNDNSRSKDMFIISVPNKFLTKKEILQKMFLGKKFYIYLSEEEKNDFESNNEEHVKNEVKLMRLNNWENKILDKA